MTCIAFKDGVLAADTLTTADGVRSGFAQKIFRAGRLRIGAAGSAPLIEKFRDWLAAGMVGDAPLHSDDAAFFVIAPSAPAVMWTQNGPWRIREPFWALGSGEHFAKGAMMAGASAEEAVLIAAQVCTGVGGRVMVLR